MEAEDLRNHTSVNLPANLDFSAPLRDFTLAAIKNIMCIDHKWAYRMQLVVDEIFMNAVRYGSSLDARVFISFDITPNLLKVIVEDTGTGEKKMTAKELTARIEEARKEHFKRSKRRETNFNLNGRGLSQIVEAWVDNLKFEDRPEGGLKVTASKQF